MNTLKFALSKQSEKQKDKNVNGSYLRGVNKSKSESIWALDVDNEENPTEQSLQNDNILSILNQKLLAAFQKDPKSITDIVFECIVEQFQDEVGGNKSEISYLKLIEDKLSDIIEISKEQYKKFLRQFNGKLQAKISKIRGKEKKSQLSNYDKIVSGNFKKKTEKVESKMFLEVDQVKPNRHSREKQRLTSKSPNRKQSNDNKLNRLLSKEKHLKEPKELSRGAEDNFNATAMQNQDESVSFSNVLATSMMAVKSRKRKSSGTYKQKQKLSKNDPEQNKKSQKEQGDEAFIFYRPKKNKK